MTAFDPMPQFHNLTNQFTSNSGMSRVNFRNGTDKRDSVGSIEIKDGTRGLVWIDVNPEDNIAMALSILGIGRVTDDVERKAQDKADILAATNYGLSEEDVLEQAVTALRAILIAREQGAKQSEAEMDAAYALYKLAYPKTTLEREGFEGTSMKDHWISNLRKMRKDPTVLGAL